MNDNRITKNENIIAPICVPGTPLNGLRTKTGAAKLYWVAANIVPVTARIYYNKYNHIYKTYSC